MGEKPAAMASASVICLWEDAICSASANCCTVTCGYKYGLISPKSSGSTEAIRSRRVIPSS